MPGLESENDAGTEAGPDASLGDAPNLSDGGGGEAGCVNLQCRVKTDCGRTGNTRITGHVYDPAGLNPLYNVYVFVPNRSLDPFDDGVTCDQCGTLVSGNPVTVTLTGPDGRFTLNDAPSGDDIPLVMQIGKWRRQITIPHVAECEDTVLEEPEEMRLPRNRSEGDMPQIAIETGTYDPFECLLRKIGIDATEFTAPSGGGAVHFYRGDGPDITGGAPAASALHESLDVLKRYDVIILPCASQLQGGGGKNIVDYTSAGGRVFITDLAVISWIQGGYPPFPSAATWGGGSSGTIGDVDMTFPKGEAFAEWLMTVGASTELGKVSFAGEFVNSITNKAVPPSVQWISIQGTTKTFSFNMPIEAEESARCGRVVSADFHVSGGERTSQMCPDCCKMDPMSNLEKTLEFLFFDMSGCVLPDDEEPIPIVK